MEISPVSASLENKNAGTGNNENPAPLSKKEERAARRRDEILEASLDVFSEKGYHATGIADIAEKLGIGHGTFYRYFKNKLDIFNALIDRVIAHLMEVIASEDPGYASNIQEYQEQLERIGDRLFSTVFLRDKRLGRIIFYESMGVDPQVSQKLQMGMELFARYTEQYLQNGVSKGFLRQDIDTGIGARIANAAIFEGTKQVLISPNPEQLSKDWVDTLIKIYVQGVKP